MSYGKYPRKGKGRSAPAASKNIRVKINGKHDLEQLSFALQKMIARLQEQNVQGVRFCSVYFEPLDKQGERKNLMDDKGRPVEIIEIDG